MKRWREVDEGITPLIRHLRTRRSGAFHVPAPSFRRKSPSHPLNRTLVAPRKTNPTIRRTDIVPLPGTEPRILGRRTRSLVTMLSELYQLHLSLCLQQLFLNPTLDASEKSAPSTACFTPEQWEPVSTAQTAGRASEMVWIFSGRENLITSDFHWAKGSDDDAANGNTLSQSVVYISRTAEPWAASEQTKDPGQEMTCWRWTTANENSRRSVCDRINVSECVALTARLQSSKEEIFWI